MTENHWPELEWDRVVERVSPLVFRVYAAGSTGTAFAVSCCETNGGEQYLTILATTLHVLSRGWQPGEELRLVSADQSKVFSNKEDEIRVHEIGHAVHDTIMIVVQSDRPMVHESQLLPMLSFESMLPRGADIGWLGFPDLVETELCFFRGHISGYNREPPTYLVDGTVISGVSGGPAVDNRAHLIGLVSSFIPDKTDKPTKLPGLMSLVPTDPLCMFMDDYGKANGL